MGFRPVDRLDHYTQALARQTRLVMASVAAHLGDARWPHARSCRGLDHPPTLRARAGRGPRCGWGTASGAEDRSRRMANAHPPPEGGAAAVAVGPLTSRFGLACRERHLNVGTRWARQGQDAPCVRGAGSSQRSLLLPREDYTPPGDFWSCLDNPMALLPPHCARGTRRDPEGPCCRLAGSPS